MSDKILITAEGKKKFEDELRYLKNEATDQNRKEIAAAREQGDLSENADYDAAKDKETEIAARINKLQYILDNCEVIVADGNSRKKDTVQIGKKVTIKDLSDEGYIDSSDLKDPKSGKKICGVVRISYEADNNQYSYEFVQEDC